jgi:hypothetical protein
MHVPTPITQSEFERLKDELRREMDASRGPLLGGIALARALGLESLAALRQARRRGRIAINLFSLPQRRGYFALTADVAEWLARARLGIPDSEGAPDLHIE